MEAAPKLNIIKYYFVVQAAYCTHQNQTAYLVYINTQALSGNHLFCMLSSGQLYHIINYSKSQRGKALLGGGGGGGGPK